MGTKDKYIHFVSQPWQGKFHDYRQLKHHFPPDQPWFSELAIELDLGYQGVVKDYDCQSVSQPTKKPKGGELTPDEKASNKAKSSSGPPFRFESW
jgi:hypothetical protein